MTFVSRLILVAVVSVTAAVVAVAVIAFSASDRVGAEIERARVANLLGTLRASTEANLSIGLALDQISCFSRASNAKRRATLRFLPSTSSMLPGAPSIRPTAA